MKKIIIVLGLLSCTLLAIMSYAIIKYSNYPSESIPLWATWFLIK